MSKTAEEIQYLVDEHALFGMTHLEIKLHLIKDHGLPIDTRIPPVSKRASKDIQAFLKTGKPPKWLNKNEIITNVNPAKTDKKNTISDGDLEEIMSRVTIAEKSFTFDDIEKNKNVYQSQHPTSFDRWFFTQAEKLSRELDVNVDFSNLLSSIGIPPSFSSYQKFEGFVKRGAIHIGMSLSDIYKKFPAEVEHIFFSQWFGKQKTFNMQIDANDCEEILASEQAYRRPEWYGYASKQPVYIDIKFDVSNCRYISGIASVPLPNGKIRYICLIEWKNIDLQGTIQWEDEDLSEDEIFIQLHSDSIADGGVTVREYQEAAALSIRLYRSCLNLRYFDQMILKSKLPILSRVESENSKKDKKNRKKSIFSFNENVLRDNFFKRTINAAANKIGWKLDHIVGVKGHFRNQPYGPGLKKTKIIWINPYTKGSGEIESKLDKHILDKLKKI